MIEEGVKLELSRDKLRLSVNSTNSGDGNEVVAAKYDGEDLTIGFNSKYLIDIASEIEDKNLTFSLKTQHHLFWYLIIQIKTVFT